MTSKVVALGFFDGVHIGHGALLTKAVSRGKELGLPSGAMTFDLHPEALVFGRELPLINNRTDRELLMKELYGIDEVIFAHFDREMMEMPWEDFVTDYLISGLGAAHVVCGHDYTFGYRGLGTAEKLQELCRKLGIGCDVIPKVTLGDVTVSSTYIRQLLSEGKVERAAEFLGHPHRISGRVVSGKQLGRTMGLPTANIAMEDGILCPAHGVYACKAHVLHKVYPAVANIGVRPTVDSSGTVSVEPYILDFSGDIYGENITLELIKFLRPEAKFSSTDDLKAAIEENVRQTREIIKL